MATFEERQTEALRTTIGWLESELRETRGAVAKLAQAIEQWQGQSWELGNRIHKVEEAVAAIFPRLAAIPEVEGQLHQLRDVVARANEQQVTLGGRVNEMGRQVETNVERDRQILNEFALRVDGVERVATTSGARFDALDEGSRRAMEAITLVRQRLEEFGRAVDAIETRVARLGETGSRVDHEFARLSTEIDTLRRQDEITSERVQAYTEMIKRVEGQIAVVAADTAVKQDVLEQIELRAVESRRVEERISAIEAAAETLRDHDDEVSRRLTLLDGRLKGFQERLVGMHRDVAAHRALVAEQFQRLNELQERLKRRRLEELERDLREIRVAAFRMEEVRRNNEEA